MDDNWINEEIPPVKALSGPDCVLLSEIYAKADFIEQHPLSLTDKVTLTRLLKPCRGLFCKHFQCFDYDLYMARNAEKTPAEYSCPVCDVVTNPTKVFIDLLWVSLLEHFPTSISDIVLYADATCGPKPRIASKQPKIMEVYDVDSDEVITLTTTSQFPSSFTSDSRVPVASVLLSTKQLSQLGYTDYSTLSHMLSSNVHDVLYLLNHDDHTVSLQPIMDKYSFDFYHFRPFVCQSLSSLLHDIASKMRLPASRGKTQAKSMLDDILVLCSKHIQQQAGDQIMSILSVQQVGGAEEEKKKKKKRKRERRESCGEDAESQIPADSVENEEHASDNLPPSSAPAPAPPSSSSLSNNDNSANTASLVYPHATSASMCATASVSTSSSSSSSASSATSNARINEESRNQLAQDEATAQTYNRIKDISVETSVTDKASKPAEDRKEDIKPFYHPPAPFPAHFYPPHSMMPSYPYPPYYYPYPHPPHPHFPPPPPPPSFPPSSDGNYSNALSHPAFQYFPLVPGAYVYGPPPHAHPAPHVPHAPAHFMFPPLSLPPPPPPSSPEKHATPSPSQEQIEDEDSRTSPTPSPTHPLTADTPAPPAPQAVDLSHSQPPSKLTGPCFLEALPLPHAELALLRGRKSEAHARGHARSQQRRGGVSRKLNVLVSASRSSISVASVCSKDRWPKVIGVSGRKKVRRGGGSAEKKNKGALVGERENEKNSEKAKEKQVSKHIALDHPATPPATASLEAENDLLATATPDPPRQAATLSRLKRKMVTSPPSDSVRTQPSINKHMRFADADDDQEVHIITTTHQKSTNHTENPTSSPQTPSKVSSESTNKHNYNDTLNPRPQTDRSSGSPPPVERKQPQPQSSLKIQTQPPQKGKHHRFPSWTSDEEGKYPSSTAGANNGKTDEIDGEKRDVPTGMEKRPRKDNGAVTFNSSSAREVGVNANKSSNIARADKWSVKSSGSGGGRGNQYRRGTGRQQSGELDSGVAPPPASPSTSYHSPPSSPPFAPQHNRKIDWRDRDRHKGRGGRGGGTSNAGGGRGGDQVRSSDKGKDAAGSPGGGSFVQLLVDDFVNG